MHPSLPKIISNFQEAAWDLSIRISILPSQLQRDVDKDLNPKSIIQDFMRQVNPFLNLQGTDIPKNCHLSYDQIDATIREEIMPSLEVLEEDWNELNGSGKTIDSNQLLGFASECAYVANRVEMCVIAQIANLIFDLSATPT